MREVKGLARPFNFVGQLGGGLSIAVPSDPARIAEAEVLQLPDHKERAALYAGKVDEEAGLFSSGDEYLRVFAVSTAALVFHDTCCHVFPSCSALLAFLQVVGGCEQPSQGATLTRVTTKTPTRPLGLSVSPVERSV